jgi:hypothetical protein
MKPYPFPIPATLLQHLPAPSRDGNHYLDVCVAGRWDGVIVVDRNGLCIGIYIRGRIEEYPLWFTAGDIKAVRKASILNHTLAHSPFDLYNLAVLAIVVFSPLAFSLSLFVSPFFALLSVLACIMAIYIMYLTPAFPFTRLPVALCGLCQIILGCSLLIRSVW